MNLKKCTISLLAALACHVAWAAGDLTPETLAAKYPPGSIQSEETAEQALREVDQQRAGVEQKFATGQHDCYSRFFATNCLDAAKEERRVALAQIRKVEVDANAYIRSARVVERDRKLAAKREHDAANPPTPIGETAPKQNSSSPADHDPNEGARRSAEHDAKAKAQQQQDAAKAPERAAKAEAYNKKVADAEQRQRDVAQKKAEKQKDAENKAAKAAKSQKPGSAGVSASGSASASASASAAPVPASTPAAPSKP